MKLQSMTEEIWKPVVGYEKYYQISNLGKCKSLPRNIIYKGDDRNRKGNWRGKLLKPIKTKDGYLKYQLCVDGKCKRFFAHRLVAMSFIPNPENKPQVNHLNSIRNDNRIDNLEWATISENQKHAYDNGYRENRFYGTCCVKRDIELTQLISLSDFVISYEPSREQIASYAKFLQKPLKLSFFVPMDEEGNVLEEPEMCCSGRDCGCMGMPYNYMSREELEEYQQAKERVLFEIGISQKLIEALIKNEMTVEDLLKTNKPVTLTPTAIKQIGL